MLKRIILIIACIFLFLLSLFHGSVSIPMGEVARTLLGKGNDISNTIILATRLPHALTPLLAGAALAVSGLLLQTAFRNPLAAPDIFGVTSGASLAVALLTLAPGLVVGGMLSWLSSIAAAFIGAMVVTMIIWFFSRMVRSSVLLIIIGMMIGYFCSSIITLLNSLATEEGVHSFVVWGMGDFTNVGLDCLPLFAWLTILTTLSTLLLVNPVMRRVWGSTLNESVICY